MDDPYNKYFSYGHLPPHLQAISKPFGDVFLALKSMPNMERGQLEIAKQKLLEAKDAAVRAALP